MLIASIPLNWEKRITQIARSASRINIHKEIDSDDWLKTIFNDKKDYFNLPIVNFSCICSNIPAVPV